MLKNKIIYYVCLIIFPVVILLNYHINPNALYSRSLEVLMLLFCIILGLLSLVFHNKNNSFLCKLLFSINVVLCLFISVWTMLSKYDVLSVFSSIASFKQFILSTKEKGMFVYVLIQFLQVLFVPIPSMIITLTGVAIYGPVMGALLCTIGVLSGSYCSFFIGKVFGFKIVSWITGRENAQKYANLINDRGKFFLIIAFLLPLFPDDILCLIAGITTMKFKHFFWIALITRPIGVICMSFFGGGYVIPFTGWGLFVWPFILIIAIVAVFMLTKHQQKIECWLIQRLPIKKKSR